MRRNLIGLVALVLFVFVVWAANLAVSHWPAGAPVGFGLTAPAAVYFVGLAFTLRDVVHRTLGRAAVVAAILGGSLVSLVTGGNAQLGGVLGVAAASAIAFLGSELCDLFVYEGIRRRGWLPAVAASNVVGLVVDSLVFLWLAFGSLAFFWGQVVGKFWMTLAAIAVLGIWRWRLEEPVPA